MIRTGRWLALLLIVGAATTVSAAPITVMAELSGDQERPVMVDTDATGVGIATFDLEDPTYLDFHIEWKDLQGDPLVSHIHIRLADDPDINGPVVFNFGSIAGLTSKTGTVTPAMNFIPRPEVGINTFLDGLLAIVNGRGYFNIHSTSFPPGEIRGNIAAVPEPGTLIGAAAGLLGLAGWRVRERRRTARRTSAR